MCGSQARADRRSEHLLVRSGGQRCAIPVDAAHQVTGPLPLEPVPGSAPRLLGLAQFAGEPLAVVDLHGLLDPEGLPSGGYRLTVIVRPAGGEAAIGLAVEEALGVVAVSPDETPCEADPPWVAGRSRVDGRATVLVEPGLLFDRETAR
jgi:chemotaxis signal transduction protein